MSISAVRAKVRPATRDIVVAKAVTRNRGGNRFPPEIVEFIKQRTVDVKPGEKMTPQQLSMCTELLGYSSRSIAWLVSLLTNRMKTANVVQMAPSITGDMLDSFYKSEDKLLAGDWTAKRQY